ncbi:MAG: ECF-type sigma factor [Planctomycetota bacterium]
MSANGADVTRILNAVADGDTKATDELLVAVYQWPAPRTRAGRAGGISSPQRPRRCDGF